ncbi:M23 family metallopeptidase [Streptomyces sp. CC219B]|uniref:M23 family metallopeptidase n=1 Tax=Streptomyces sp. CC219B TaxID=3044574 RepID=UPI0024A980BA|nr:M23 family metallopeptidase [Streptomyces sp. CC219B]
MTTPAPASDAASAHYASYGTEEAQYGDFTTYGAYDTTGFQQPVGTFDTDPLFGCMPGEGTGSYDSGHGATGSHQTLNYDAYAAQHHASYDTGAYDTTAWTADYQQLSAVPQQATGPDASGWGSPAWGTDTGTWLQPEQSGTPADRTQQWEWGTQSFDTGAYDATQWNAADSTATGTGDYEQPSAESFDQQATATFEQVAYDESSYDETAYGESAYGESAYGESAHDETAYGESAADEDELTGTGELPAVAPVLDGQEDAPAPGSRVAARNAGRSRRRTPAKRSALLTVAVPSACVMGVAGIAAASVSTLTDDQDNTSTTASDAKAVQPSAANNKLNTQLESLSAGAADFGDRVSRTQERLDLKAQQEAERKKAAEEAARKERLRPKFALPVAQHGLSAYYGQAGINWMSVHTGIDFPVSYGTTVMAATDGTVRTQWNSAYGNMMIVTAMDGTETWYCHLSSYRVPSGTTVKAGDPIAYSGNSGNSTGPHLHFEVRPGGGSAIDPLAWLRSHGLEPS